MAKLTIRNAVKRYGALEVLHGVSVAAQDGEFMVLVGPSGCSKSTLLRMIAGLESISDGEIEIGAASSTISNRTSATSPWYSSPTRSIRT
jgi:multiple sugar transport system ATP-binding protein